MADDNGLGSVSLLGDQELLDLMADDNGPGILVPLVKYLVNPHRHELINLGLPTTQANEIKKINDSEFLIAQPVLLPLPKLPIYRLTNSTSGSHPPFLSNGSTESTSRSELSDNKDRRLSAGIQRATPTPSKETSSTTRNLYCCTKGCHIWFEKKGDWKRHEELQSPQAHWICCNEEFAGLDKWREHQRIIHKSNPSPCEIESATKLLVGNFPKNCGFCSCKTTGWTERINHVGDHLGGKIRGVSNRREVLQQVEDTDGDCGSFLLTEHGESESTENHRNDPQTSNNGAAGAWLAVVHVRVVQSLLDRVNNLLHRGHPSQSQPSTRKSSSSKAVSSGTLRGSTSSGNSINRVRKGQRKTGNSPDEDSEEERPDQETPPKSAQGDLATGIEFACPYHKANPGEPHPKRCERGSWKTISKLKHEHLQRHHTVQSNTISDEVLAKLCEKESLGKKSNLTLEDKWGAIYRVLFPEATVIPCPYYGIDWPSPTGNTSLATTEGSFSQQQGTPLQSDLPFAEQALQSAILDLGFFPVVMTNIRCMLEREEKLHQERIKASLPKIVRDTYWDFVSTLNHESTEGRRNDNSESARTWHPVATDTSVFHEPMKDGVAGTFGVINPTHCSATHACVGEFANTPHLPEIHAVPDTTKIVEYHTDPLVSNDMVMIYDSSQAPSPGDVGEERGKYSHPMPQVCGDPTQHSHFINLQRNHY